MANDAMVYWVTTTEEEIHFLDAVLSAYDGLANVRREFRLRDGTTQYKIYVSPGMEDEFLEVFSRLKQRVRVGALIRDDGYTPFTPN